MAAARLGMRKTRETSRQKWSLGMSNLNRTGRSRWVLAPVLNYWTLAEQRGFRNETALNAWRLGRTDPAR